MTVSPLGTDLDTLFAQAQAVPRRHFLAFGAAMVAATSAAPTGALAQNKVSRTVTDKDREHMRQAIATMRKAGIVDKTGGPFGAVIVRDGEVLAVSGNSVLRDNDPSAHAEVNAIRMACRKIGEPNLRGATLFTSCEPCPMCYSTAYWARISKIYYAASWQDYADLFDDSNIGDDIKKPYPQRALAPEQLLREDAQTVWAEFRKMPDGARY